MNEYTVFETGTGRVLRIVQCAEEDAGLQAGEDEEIVPGAHDPRAGRMTMKGAVVFRVDAVTGEETRLGPAQKRPLQERAQAAAAERSEREAARLEAAERRHARRGKPPP